MADNTVPIPNYDELPLGELRHRIRSVDERQLRTLIDHEREHGDRVPVHQLLRARLDELEAGADPAPGDPAQTPEAPRNSGGSPVGPETAAESNTPLRHGLAEQTPARGRP
jgi:hypothetical protein